MSGRLYLDFCGEEYTIEPGQSLSFGRSGDLVIDENPYMHRLVGRFRHVEGVWCVENLGRRVSLEVKDISGPSTALAAPGRAAALVFGEFTCTFAAGPTVYEVSGALEDFEWDTDLLGPAGIAGVETIDWGRVELNGDQRLLLLAMCEAKLLHPRPADVPVISNRQGAARLGWSITKFNRKLDHLCEKLQRAGVNGVHGNLGENANDRRQLLVDHALSVPLVARGELSLLDAEPLSA